MQEWEYKVWNQGDGPNPDAEAELNYLGAVEGGCWELVTRAEVPNRHGDYVYVDTRWYFKRPKQDAPKGE